MEYDKNTDDWLRNETRSSQAVQEGFVVDAIEDDLHEENTKQDDALAFDNVGVNLDASEVVLTADAKVDDRVYLSLTQLVGLRLDIPRQYWSCVEEVLRRVTFKQMPGVKGKHYVQISYDTWFTIFPDSKASRDVIDLVKDQLLLIKGSGTSGTRGNGSYLPGHFNMSYAANSKLQDMILEVGTDSASLSKKEFDTIMNRGKKRWTEAVRQLNARLDEKKNSSSKPTRLESRFNQVPVNMLAIKAALPALSKWTKLLCDAKNNDTANDLDDGPNLLRKEVKQCLGERGLEASVDYLLHTKACLLFIQSDSGSNNKLKQQYSKAASGRLFGLSSTSLQRSNSLTLKIALHGFYEYDISTCCHTIFLKVAGEYGLVDERLEEYVADKGSVRSRVARETNTSDAAVKFAITALAYGASPNTGQRLSKEGKWVNNSSIADELGLETSDKILKHEFVRDLARELRAVFKVIYAEGKDTWQARRLIKEHKRMKAERKAILDADAAAKVARLSSVKSQVVALLVQGYESRALQAAVAAHKSSVLLKFDAWLTTEPEDIEAAEAAMLAETDFPLTIDRKESDPNRHQMLIDGLPLMQEAGLCP